MQEKLIHKILSSGKGEYPNIEKIIYGGRMDKRFLTVISAVIISLFLTACGCTDDKQKEDSTTPSYKIESDKNVSEFVRTADALPMEMLYADYWIAKQKDKDKIIMTGEEIEAWNKEYIRQNSDGSLNFYNFYNEYLTETISGDDLCRHIKDTSNVPEGEFYNEKGKKYTEWFWQEVLNNCNLASIEWQHKVKYGYTINRADIRILPYSGLVTSESDSNYFCQLQVSSILMNVPVVVLHESTDGKWYYIMSNYCSGWIRKENVAICTGFSQWKEEMTPENFLIVTGNKEVLEEDTEHPKVSELVLYMGTKLEMVKYEDYKVEGTGREPFECYIVKVPIKMEDDTLGYEYAFIPVSRDVHIGYVPYTTENVIRQMFKMNGDRYGWGGMYNARDCSQYVMDIYSVFGFLFARNSAAQMEMTMKSINLENLSDEEKEKKLSNIPTGALLYFPGHIMLYLGENKGAHYVISETSRLIPVMSSGNEVTNAQSCLVTSLASKRANGRTWLRELTRAGYLGQ